MNGKNSKQSNNHHKFSSEMFEYDLLKDAGKVSNEIAKLHAET